MPSTTVRLSDALMGDCRASCDRLGVSFNALVAVALDQYVHRYGGAGVADAAPAAPAGESVRGSSVDEKQGDPCPPGLSKRERREWRKAHGMSAYT